MLVQRSWKLSKPTGPAILFNTFLVFIRELRNSTILGNSSTCTMPHKLREGALVHMHGNTSKELLAPRVLHEYDEFGCRSEQAVNHTYRAKEASERDHVLIAAELQ